jgi:hypothetical protein
MTAALPAIAGSVTADSKCVADQISGTSYGPDGGQLDSKTVTSATSSDPFRVDLAGDVGWNAATTDPIKEHTWNIGLVIGGIEVSFFNGGDPNSAGTQDSSGRVSIASRVDEIQNSMASWALDNLSGKYQIWGKLEGEGGKCEGTAWALIEGSPFGGLIGQVSAGTAAVGAALLAGAAVKKRA